MVLNWKYQGPQGWFFLADDRGYFKAAGLNVTMDQGNGSGAPIPLVANGTYDVGFGDINALIEFAAKKPEEAPIAVYVMYNRPPFTIAVRADSDINTPKDLEGKTLGGAAGDGALKLFPAFCKIAKIDCSKINITNMQPNLREQMLMQGQVDGVFGYVNTIRFSAKLIGVDPDKQIRFINYGDYGMDLYSNAIIVSKKLAKDNPAAVRGLLAAINHGLEDTLKDPDAAVAAVAKREPLINIPVERERLDATLKDEMNHPEIAKIGLGNVDLGAAEALDRHSGRRPTVCRARRRSTRFSRRTSCRRPAICRRSCSKFFNGAASPLAGGEARLNQRRARGVTMELNLKGRVAMITGPAKGMGAAITEAFAAEGARLALVGRDCAAIEPVADAVKAGGRRGDHRALRSHRRRSNAQSRRRRPRRLTTDVSTFWSMSPAAPDRSARAASKQRRKNSTTSSRST